MCGGFLLRATPPFCGKWEKEKYGDRSPLAGKIGAGLAPHLQGVRGERTCQMLQDKSTGQYEIVGNRYMYCLGKRAMKKDSLNLNRIN